MAKAGMDIRDVCAVAVMVRTMPPALKDQWMAQFRAEHGDLVADQVQNRLDMKPATVRA